MRLKVPQFIDIEDKTIGPLTIKQFLYLLVGAGILAILWLILNLGAFVIAAIPVIIISTGLAFGRFNNRPLIFLIASWFGYLNKPKLYLWKKKEKPN